ARPSARAVSSPRMTHPFARFVQREASRLPASPDRRPNEKDAHAPKLFPEFPSQQHGRPEEAKPRAKRRGETASGGTPPLAVSPLPALGRASAAPFPRLG